MTETGPPRPRRALGPLPDDDAEPVFRGGSRAMPFDPDWVPADSETQVLRRVMPGPPPDDPSSADSPAETEPPAWSPNQEAAASSPASPSGSRAWAPTPVPPPKPVPPKPVLPETTASLQASAGRRFSASAEPSEFAPAAPRRSATSVSSPPPIDFEPAARRTSRFAPSTLSPSGRRSAGSPPDSPGDGHAPPEKPTSRAEESAAAGPRKRSRGRALAVMAAVVVMAGSVAGSVWWLGPQAGPAPQTSPSPTPSAGLDPLLTPDDVARLGGTTWGTATAPTTASDGYPVCLPAAGGTTPDPDRTGRRILTADKQPDSFLTHVVETYPDVVSAQRAYTNRLQQAGSCADTEAFIVGTSSVAGLADAAFATHIEVQTDSPEHHSLVISRTGRNLSMIDVSSTEPTPLKDVAAVAARPLARLCSGGDGTCPTSVELAASLPAAGEFPGWLVKADLPRITAGAGRWGATRPSPVLTILGSQCEAVSLKKVSDATSSAQRTLLLADDPSAPAGFGIDQVVYTFDSGKKAKSFGDKLSSNLADCADRVPTAAVKKGPTTKGEAADGVAFSGRSFLITQKTAEDEEVPFRVAVVRVGDHVAYLLANPSAEFDFTSDQWKAIMTRTGQRVSQLP